MRTRCLERLAPGATQHLCHTCTAGSAFCLYHIAASGQTTMPLPHPQRRQCFLAAFLYFLGPFGHLLASMLVTSYCVHACMHRRCSLAGLKGVMHAYVLLLLAHAVLCCAVLCCAVLCCAVLCCAVLCKFAASLQAWSLERPMLCCCHAMIQGHSNYVSSKQAYIRCRRIRLLASLWIGKTHSILA